MATIRKIPSTVSGKKAHYKALIRRDGRVIKSKTFSLRKLAVAWSARIEGDDQAVAAFGAKGASTPFHQLADEFLDQWTGKDDIRGKVRFWRGALGSAYLADITDIQIDGILEEYSAGEALCGVGRMGAGRKRSPATVNRMRAMLSSIFKYGITIKKYIKINPVALVVSHTEAKGRKRYLSDDERGALLSACRVSDWDKLYLLVVLALTTGSRQGELLGLHWDEIDFKARTALLVDTKNGESRTLTIPESTMAALQQFREVGAGLVFPSPIKPRKPFEFRKHWDKAMADAGVEGFRFHDLRHSAASYLAMGGATLLEIGDVLGHKSQQTTLRYAHLSVNHKRDLTDKVLGNIG